MTPNFSFKRLRPLRATQEIRNSNADVRLTTDDLIQPFFVVDGTSINRPLNTLTGVAHLSIDQLLEAQIPLIQAGVTKVLLFGVIDSTLKTPGGEQSFQDDALVSRAVRALKTAFPQLTVITDICICAYTDHGHCGVLNHREIDNDKTLSILAEMALSHARAGADVVAPSAMMDGQVWAIRKRLDEEGFLGTKVMGYSAKYASRLYGPFRDAAGSAPGFGDRRSYQLDYRTRDQGLEEAVADAEEGASILMVKPATFYLDILNRVKTRLPEMPLAAYHTSGEFMMLHHGAKAGLFDFGEAYMENLFAIKRAGADFIITYGSLQVAEILTRENY